MNKFFWNSVKEYRVKILLYTVLQFLRQGLGLLPPCFYLLFLDEIMTARKLELLGVVMGLYVAAFLARTVVSVFSKRIYNSIFPSMREAWKRRVFQKYGSLDIGTLQGYTAGELKERLHKDTENAVLFCERKLDFWTGVLNICITAVILLRLNWILAAVSFLLLPLSFWVTRRIKDMSSLEYGKLRQIQGEYNDFMIHNMYFWKEIKANNLGESRRREFGRLWEDMGNAFLKAHMCWFMNRTFLAFKDVFLTKMGLYLLGGILAIRNMATVPVLLSFIEYYGDFANRLLEAADNVMMRGDLEESVRRVQEIMGLPQPERGEASGRFERLELRGITFSYEDAEILRDFSMVVRRGESIAIVGESGCGKSTLIKLMAGILTPAGGEILWNGCSMDVLERGWLYGKVGFLMQETSLFNLTIRENLLFGRSDADEDEMEEACSRANILQFIEGLPQGFETVIGENGIRLSGGQRQRLLIARLLLKDPEIIIFDEATSALDYQNESSILELLLEQIEGKTFIMVTHRETSISKCSRVLRL